MVPANSIVTRKSAAAITTRTPRPTSRCSPIGFHHPKSTVSWNIADLEAHYRAGYAPNNCLLVVAGDVSPKQIQLLVKKYFESIPAHGLPSPVLTREPQQR